MWLPFIRPKRQTTAFFMSRTAFFDYLQHQKFVAKVQSPVLKSVFSELDLMVAFSSLMSLIRRDPHRLSPSNFVSDNSFCCSRSEFNYNDSNL